MGQQKLAWGIPNRVGRATVFVMCVRAADVRLAVCDARGEHPVRDYAVGDSVEIDEALWQVIEIRRLPRSEDPVPPPGTGADTVVAVLARA